MKRLTNLGSALSRDQQKRILGGDAPAEGCNLIIKCNDVCWARPSCAVSECSHTDTTVTCGTVTYTNSSVCSQAGC